MESMSILFATLLTLLILTVRNGQCQFGGMMSGMGASMAAMGEIPPAEYMTLDNAVKQIVGPMASPTPSIIQIALRHGGIPTTLPQMMEYMPHFQQLAHQLNVRPQGVLGQPTAQQINNYIQQRANQWMTGNVGYQPMNMNPPVSYTTQQVVSNPAPNQMMVVANQPLPMILQSSVTSSVSPAQNNTQSQPSIVRLVPQPSVQASALPSSARMTIAMPRTAQPQMTISVPQMVQPPISMPVQQPYMSPMPMYNTIGASPGMGMMGGTGDMMNMMALGGMMDMGFGFDGLM